MSPIIVISNVDVKIRNIPQALLSFMSVKL